MLWSTIFVNFLQITCIFSNDFNWSSHSYARTQLFNILHLFGMRCYFFCCFVNYINPLWIIFHGLSYLIPLLFSVVFFWCFVNPGGVLKPTENRSSLSLRRLLLLKFFLESLFREIFFSLLQKITLSFFPRLGDGFSFERDKFKINEFK